MRNRHSLACSLWCQIAYRVDDREQQKTTDYGKMVMRCIIARFYTNWRTARYKLHESLQWSRTVAGRVANRDEIHPVSIGRLNYNCGAFCLNRNASTAASVSGRRFSMPS